MIVETIKFDRPLMNACLVGDFSGTPMPGALPTPETAAVPSADAQQIAEPSSSEGQSGSEETNRLLEAIAAGMEGIQLQSDELVKQFQVLSVRLATTIVRKVIGSSDGIQSERLANLLGEVMRRPEPAVVAFVHPDFASSVQERLALEFAPKSPLEIQIDDSLERGECRIGFATHELISNVELQLAQVEERLLEVMGDVID